MLSWAGPLDLFVFSLEIKEESNANRSSLFLSWYEYANDPVVRHVPRPCAVRFGICRILVFLYFNDNLA